MLLTMRALAVLLLGLLVCTNASAAHCHNKPTHGVCQPVQQLPPCSVTVIEETPPAQSPPSAANGSRSIWQRFFAGEPQAVSALGTWVAAIFAGIIGFLAYRINANNLRGQRVHNQIKMVLDIDKELISCPQLWGIFDGEKVIPMAPPDFNTLLKQKAFVFSYFNMFDFIYGFYARSMRIWRFKRDKEDWVAWLAYMKDFFKKSGYARELWKTHKRIGMYPKSFERFVDEEVLR
jgi:hypothetical protein